MAGTYLALVRGINVGGNRKVPMADLRALCEGAGCTGVETYIQSGNAVLESELDEAALRSALEAGIRERFGFAVEVMVRSAREAAALPAANPFPDTESVHVGFLHAPPADPAPLEAMDFAPSRLAVVGREIYLYLPGGLGRSELMVELGKRFKEPMTVRNWRTVTKMVELVAARG